MRKQIAVILVAAAALVGGQATAADIFYPPIEVPEVDYGLAGSFYLRGSAAGNAWWAKDYEYCTCFDGEFDQAGYGYSFGAGFGYETGSGLRTDLTVDYIYNRGLGVADHAEVELRSGLVMANLYYDFNFSGYGSASGGFGAYVGAGIGAAKNWTEITVEDVEEGPWGHSLEAAGAIMAGVTYDMGTVVADLGYRGIYMNKVMSQPEDLADAYLINDNFIHEVRGTLRYRFN